MQPETDTARWDFVTFLMALLAVAAIALVGLMFHA